MFIQGVENTGEVGTNLTNTPSKLITQSVMLLTEFSLTGFSVSLRHVLNSELPWHFTLKVHSRDHKNRSQSI